MKAIVFAAGLGTRLKPFTLEHPKALVPVAGVPMLRRVIEKIKAAGIREIVVNVHHFAEQIITYLAENDNFGITIHISDESSLLLDTGGGILHARRWLEGDNFLVHNADILTDFPLQQMIETHSQSEADVTLLCDSRTTSRYLLFDRENRMHGWENVKTGEIKPRCLNTDNLAPLAFGGVHVLGPNIWPMLEDYARNEGGEVFSVIPFYVANCGNLDIRAYRPSVAYQWHDVGKPEALPAAEKAIMSRGLD